jgi:hypothetical protein
MTTSEPTLTDLYGDLPAATAKLAVVADAIDALNRVVDAIGALDGRAFDALNEIAGELVTYIESLGGKVSAPLNGRLP